MWASRLKNQGPKEICFKIFLLCIIILLSYYKEGPDFVYIAKTMPNIFFVYIGILKRKFTFYIRSVRTIFKTQNLLKR